MVSRSTGVMQIPSRIILIVSGYQRAVGFLYKPQGYGAKPVSLPLTIPVGKNEPGWPIIVTNKESCYDPDKGLRINIFEPFSTFLSKLQLSVRCADSKIRVNNGDLKIGFHRTLRVPEDGRVHLLPKSFGLFPLQNLAAYAEKLQRSKNPSLLDMAKKSGVFLPMFQREAMWISFDAPVGSEYAIRVFAGGINVVSGRKWDAPPPPNGPYGREKQKNDQDYIIVPSQEHLDGIAIGDGLVRQFVAMPIGSGYSIEKQMTGREDVGGLQIEVTPTYAKLKLSIKDRDISGVVDSGGSKGEVAIPLHYGLQAGDEVMATRHGRGLPCMGGKIQRAQKKLLRELLPPQDRSNTAIMALYEFKVQITVKGKMMKHTIETSEFSPFATLKEVATRTTFRGKDLLEYEFWLGEKRIPLEVNLAESGVYEQPVLDAKKPSGGLRPYEVGDPLPSMPVHSMETMSYDSHRPSRISGLFSGWGRKSCAAEVQPLEGSGPYGIPETYHNPNSDPNWQIAGTTYNDRMSDPRPQFRPQSFAAGNESLTPNYAHAAPRPHSVAFPSTMPAPKPAYGAIPQAAWGPSAQESIYSPPIPQSHPYGSSIPQQSAPLQQSAPPQLPTSSAPNYGASTPPYPPQRPQFQSSPSAIEATCDESAQSTTASLAIATANRPTTGPVYEMPVSYSPPRPPSNTAPVPATAPFAASPSATPSYTASPSAPPPSAAPSSIAPSFTAPSSTAPSSIAPSTPAAPSPQQPRPPSPKEQESWAMGLAPGGLLRQEIQRDNDIHRATSLNRSATCLISVQLLNSVAYEAITGMLCPPTPITLQTYVAAGIPWFDTYRNNTAETSGYANFSGIRSVGEIDAGKGVTEGVSVAEKGNVACTVCKRNFCDCVLRPCNHAFCAACVRGRMFAKDGYGRVQGRCWECGTGVRHIVGFSAPMGLPGEEGIWPNAKVEVVVAKGGLGKFCFELE